MNFFISHYQVTSDTGMTVYRFIYVNEAREVNVVSVKGRGGMRAFLAVSGAELLDNSVNIWHKAKSLREIISQQA